MEKHTSGDNAEVIDNRLKRLIQELLAHQQRCSHHATGKKKYLRRQKKPRHVLAGSTSRPARYNGPTSISNAVPRA